MQTIPDVLDRARTLFGDRVVSDGHADQTYAETYTNAERLAGTLADAGVEEGDVVAVADWNTPAFLELLYAATGMGAVVYPVNLNLPPEQIGYTLQKSDSRWLLYSEDFAGIADAFPGGTMAIADLDYGERRPLDATEDDLGVMLFTSGTTGQPKAIRYRHREMVQGALSIAHQLSEYDTPASLSGDNTIIPGIPMFHILSWGSSLIGPYLGEKLVLSGRFDPETMAGLFEREDEPWTNLVPTMVGQVLQTDADLGGLKLATGGSAIPRDLMDRLHDRGVEFSTIYGGTDMLAASISIRTDAAREEGADYLRRVTHPVPFGEFRLERHEGMEEDMGEIYFRAPWLPDGYYGDPEKTANTFVDGWFRTGDVGRRTRDGGVMVLDRLKDTIKSGGEWIPSSVLESVISEVPSVAQVAVLGTPDEEWGERPIAVVTAVEGSDVDADAIREYLEEQAAAGRINEWWIPDAFHAIDEMPLTSTGKIKKAELESEVDVSTT
ncbi:AMP-binding protein [Halobacteriaceae archaeon GCM10025711]